MKAHERSRNTLANILQELLCALAKFNMAVVWIGSICSLVLICSSVSYASDLQLYIF